MATSHRWSRLFGCLSEDSRILAVGPLASWLYVCGQAYCTRNLTDGRIPAGIVTRLGDVDDALALARRLVEVGLWADHGDHYQHGEHCQMQSTAEAVLASREQARLRQRRKRQRDADAAWGPASQTSDPSAHSGDAVSEDAGVGAVAHIGTLPPVADRRARHDGDPPRACMVSCDPDLTDAAVRVYWVMARHSDHEGRCVIGLPDIAAMAFKVPEQIPALIDQLRRREHVVVRKAGAGLAYYLPGVPDFARAADCLPLNGGHP